VESWYRWHAQSQCCEHAPGECHFRPQIGINGTVPVQNAHSPFGVSIAPYATPLATSSRPAAGRPCDIYASNTYAIFAFDPPATWSNAPKEVIRVPARLGSKMNACRECARKKFAKL
jgi:hypothetical protein